jgi:hypothetical protein
MEKIMYLGNVYNNHTDAPFDKDDLKLIKQIESWGKPDKIKDKRPGNIQHCYAIILKKGINSPKVPDKRWLNYEDLRPLSTWLEVGNKDCNAFLEPLRVAKAIYLETIGV